MTFCTQTSMTVFNGTSLVLEPLRDHVLRRDVFRIFVVCKDQDTEPVTSRTCGFARTVQFRPHLHSC